MSFNINGSTSEIKTSYTGFEVKYKTGEKLSYFEKAQKTLLEMPFATAKDKLEFELPLKKWKEHCDADRKLRRESYGVSKFSDLEKAKSEALRSVNIPREGKASVNLILWRGPVNEIEVDAAVNSANETLLGGGGTDFRIHSTAGPLLVRECATFKDGCQVGDAKLTKGYALPASFVIHTVGPLLLENEKPDCSLLAKCYISSLDICEKNEFKSVVFPCVSCGFYGFPLPISASVVLPSVINYIEKHAHSLETIVLAFHKDISPEAYIAEFDKLFPSSTSSSIPAPSDKSGTV